MCFQSNVTGIAVFSYLTLSDVMDLQTSKFQNLKIGGLMKLTKYLVLLSLKNMRS